MQRLATSAMGTRFEVVLAGPADVDLAAAGEAAIAEIDECHRRLSRFAPDSLVSHIARSAGGVPLRLDRDTYVLFSDALSVWRASGGAFDVAVAPLMAEHGFQPSAVAVRPPAGTDTVVLDEATWSVTFLSRDVGLDFGAIAKGHALDLAGAALRDAGVRSALLHGGTSSVLAIGAPPGADGWKVALRFDASCPTVVLRDSGLSVSNPASKAGSCGESHIVDPRSRRPVVRPGRVAVLGPSARLCDAWTTALVVLGSVPAAFPSAYRAIFEADTV